MINVKRIFEKITCFALMLLMGGGVFLSAFSISASAAETTTSYSNVLDDLKRDQSFDPADYPTRSDDYSLDVIHVAEGENGEVFIYVYQPSDATKDLRAAKINMSLQDPTERDVTYKLYNLTWLNSSGVFDKYLVNDLTVPVKDVRYYSIAAIYRAFDEDIDDPANDDDDIKDFEGLPVGKSWAVSIYNGEYTTVSKNVEYVDVEIQSVGFTRYLGGFMLHTEACDSHFVAFSVENFDVAWVYDADITFTRQNAKQDIGLGLNGEIVYEDPVTEKSYKVVDVSEGGTNLGGWFVKNYTWNRIVKTETFISEIEDQTNEFLTEKDEANLSKADFVIRFIETDYTAIHADTYSSFYWTNVFNVAVLRLHFLTDNGKTYNLGVVSDIVSDDGLPDFVVDSIDHIQNMLEESWEIFLAILGLVILIAAIVLLSFIGLKPMDILRFVFKGVALILLAPFRFFKWLFTPKKKRYSSYRSRKQYNKK